MEIRYENYPYPVLGDGSGSYRSGSFETAVGCAQEGYNVKFTLQARLDCAALQQLIDDEKAKFVYHLECAQTGFRKVVMTDNAETAVVITNKEVRGKLQICPFIVAVQDIADYTSADFDEDYAGIGFNIETGCRLALGEMAVIDINKDIDDLANTPSIFAIIPNSDRTAKAELVDYSGRRKIRVLLPAEQFYRYQAFSQAAGAQPILTQAVIMPALVNVLGRLMQLDEAERAESSDALWYRVLKKALKNEFNCEIESDDFTQQDALDLAQKLLNDPLADAFNFLAAVTGGDEE